MEKKNKDKGKYRDCNICSFFDSCGCCSGDENYFLKRAITEAISAKNAIKRDKFASPMRSRGGAKSREVRKLS